ncbi:beta-alanyl-bioamine nonribosomal peptide synthetase ebony-like isoform X2 [Episyrphus balteatus]|uniref:beta-alanyl-bioamine nonribosomal peptide synthetase ebony-like isoform X2 n=1 Tax=Episyrphus balteatus TaxID=286459 RepID=UPI002486718F|nr:beta-alanyl-bioamine nonribosomal peptide synthetase ebony-like isoform X2 [Episyrphus balteatus]
MPSKSKLQSIIRGPQYDLIPRRLHKLFEDKVLENPNKSALIYDGKVLTRKEVNERSNQYARVFLRETLKHSLSPNQDGDNIIAMCMEPSDYLVMILLATWKAGFAYIAIDPILTPNRIAHILNDARPVMVICDNDMDQRVFGSYLTLSLNELNEKCFQMDVTSILDDEMKKSSQDLAVVLYTSGSTGVPKGVKLPPIALLNRLKWQWITFPFNADENVGLLKSSLAFVDSVLEIWSTLLHGLTILVVPKPTTKDPEKLVKLLDEYQIGRIMLVPTLLRNIIMYLQMESKTHNNNDRLLSKLKNWVCSGEPLQKQLVEQFFDCFEEGTQLHNFYGCTEVMGDVTYFTCKSKQHLKEFEKIPIGLPVANTEIYILDNDYKPVSHGEIGQIFIAGLPLANGYVNGRDRDRFMDNPLVEFTRLYKTGDFGSFRKGYIHFEGRLDSQIKIRGHRVDLTEVERTILSFDFVEKAIVLCYQVDPIDRTLLAFVQFNDLSPRFSELEIEKALKGKLQDYMIPQVIIVDHFPLLVNGKIDRQELLRSYERKRNDVIPMDFSQVPDDLKVIARDAFNIIESVIGRSARGTLTVESNFYEMGGNSLNSIIAVTLLREKGYHIEISDFISAKNLGEVLRTVSNELTKLIGDCKLAHLNMKAFPLTEDDKSTAIKILVDSFYDKGDLEYWIKEDISRQDYIDIFEDLWDDALNKGYSFIVKDMDTKEITGVAINFDARDEPKCLTNSKVDSVFDIVSVLEGPFRQNQMAVELNKIFYTSFSATSVNLNPQENIACIYLIEEEVINLAKRKNFTGVLTSNVSPLTQQLGNDVFNYKCLVDYQVNQFIYKDGTRPFALAPDSQKIMVQYKEL